VIAQVLNRDFVMQATGLLRTELEREAERRKSGGGRRAGLATPVDDLEDEELSSLVESLGQLTVDAAEDLGPMGDAPPREDFAFIPRDPLLSLVQTTIDEHVEESAGVEIEESPLPDRRGGGGEVPAVTDRRIADIAVVEAPDCRRKWGDMEITRNKLFSDPGWLTSGFAMAVRFFRGKAKWVDKPPTISIDDRARIVLVGDWGSGLPRAKKVSDQIRRVLAEDEDRERHVIHLGDVYYSGSKREYDRNFLNLRPVYDNEDIGSYSLCGNHDMYYGGHAYYGTCLADARFSRQAGCSHFELESPHWKLIGLDSGYEDGGLQGDQAGWARSLIDASPDHKVALFSHHQLFSAHEDGAATMREKIRPVLATDRVDAWFWGHEHRCIQYEESQQKGHRVGFASCLGHGGVPEYLVMKEGNTKPPPPWAYEYLKPYGSSDESWETFGFAVVDLDGPRMSVRYIDEDGVEHHRVPEVVKSR
jgi:3',5'-cyclic AMP phosphodiesterase CpdA